MSDSQDDKAKTPSQPIKSDTEKQGNSQRPASPNPFLQFLGTSPKNISPRSEIASNNMSPRSPRDGVNGSPRDFMGASPAKFATIDQFMMASNAIQNMTLAHEISVDQNFKLEKPQMEPDSLEKQIHDTVHKAFWQSLKEDFEKEPVDYKHALVIIGEAKAGLLSLLLPNHVKFREQIEAVLDMDLMKNAMDKNIFDYKQYALFIIDTMSKLCAPARDADLEKLSKMEEPVDVFRGIMETLELLKLDMANYTIQQMRPHIQQQVVAYEQKKFKEVLETQKEVGVDGLEATKEWLARALKRIKSNETIGAYKYENGPTPSAVCNEAFMELFVWKSALPFPETLAMDELRFNEIYIKCRKFLVVCAIINTVYSLVGESIRGLEELRSKLKQHILVLLEDCMTQSFEEMMKNIGEQVIKLTNDALVKHDKKKLNETQVTTIKGLIIDLSSKNLLENTVYKLLFTRYIDFLQGVLTKRTQGPVKLPQGMGTMEKDILSVTGSFLKLVSFNKNVFGSYYGEIIQSQTQ